MCDDRNAPGVDEGNPTRERSKLVPDEKVPGSPDQVSNSAREIATPEDALPGANGVSAPPGHPSRTDEGTPASAEVDSASVDGVSDPPEESPAALEEDSPSGDDTLASDDGDSAPLPQVPSLDGEDPPSADETPASDEASQPSASETRVPPPEVPALSAAAPPADNDAPPSDKEASVRDEVQAGTREFFHQVRQRVAGWHLSGHMSRAWRRFDVFGVEGAARRQHKGLKYLWYYGFFASSAGAFFSSFSSLYLLALGGTRRDVGWLAAAASFVGMLAPIPGAAITQRWGRPRAMVVIGTVLRRSTLLLAALAPFFLSGNTLIFTVIALLSVRLAFVGLYNPALMSLMAAVIPKQIRGSYLGARKMAMAMATVVLVPFAGWIIDRIGEPAGFQIGLVAAFVLGLVSAFFIWIIPETQVQESIKEQKDGGTLWEALRHSRVFRRYILIRLFWNFSHQIGGPFFRVYQREVLLTPMQLIGLLVTVSAITRLIGQRFWGHVVDRRGARWVLGVCALTIPVVPFVWVFVTRPWHVVFAQLPGGFLWAGFEMGALNLLLNLPAPKHRTQAAALHATAVRAGNIAGPLVGNMIIQQLGYRWDFALSGAGRLMAALLFVALLRPFAKAQAIGQAESQQPEAQGKKAAT